MPKKERASAALMQKAGEGGCSRSRLRAGKKAHTEHEANAGRGEGQEFMHRRTCAADVRKVLTVLRVSALWVVAAGVFPLSAGLGTRNGHPHERVPYHLHARPSVIKDGILKRGYGYRQLGLRGGLECSAASAPSQRTASGTQSTSQSRPQEVCGRLTVSTFNVLCPLFRRVPQNGTEGEMGRESGNRSMYLDRHAGILELLLQLDSDIICLQEFWVGNDDLVALFRAQLDVRYQWFALARTAGRGDGLVVLVKHALSVTDRHDIFFRDLGDRVALLLKIDYSAHLASSSSSLSSSCKRARTELLLVNTHLLFPHQVS